MPRRRGNKKKANSNATSAGPSTQGPSTAAPTVKTAAQENLHPNGKQRITIRQIQKVYNLARPLRLLAFSVAGMSTMTSEFDSVTVKQVQEAMKAQEELEEAARVVYGTESVTIPPQQRWALPKQGSVKRMPMYWDGPDLDERRAAVEGERSWGDERWSCPGIGL